MIKQPLFGQDSSPHITSTFLSAIITFVLWLVMTITGALIKIKPVAPKYKEVQIVLSSTPVVEKESSEASESAAAAMQEETSAVVEEAPAVVEEAPAVVEEAPAVVEPVETTPAPKVVPPSTSSGTTETNTSTTKTNSSTSKASSATTKKTETPAKTTDPAKKVNFDDYQYATDYSDFDFNNVSTSSSKNSFDWSQFDDSSESEPQISQQVKTVTTQSSVGGSAASVAAQTDQRVTSSQTKTSNTTSQTASSATSNALSNIRSTQYSASTGNSIKSITDAKTTKGSDGTLSMSMSDGTTRVLLDPIPPIIRLSEAAAALIDSTRTVTIEFQVLASGNVPRSQITITPESRLPQAVRTEIYDQLSKWLFETSSSAARATFEYTIKKQ